MENTPEAAPQGTEAPITNSNPAPEAPAQAPETPSVDLHGFTGEQLAEMAKFMDANGGYDKAFKTFKERISNPAPEAPKAPEQPSQPQQSVEQPAQQHSIPKGYISQRELMAQQYYGSLASQPEYAAIADKISSGDVFNEMAKFGISPMDADGNINDTQVREFLNLYAKTVPAKPAAEPQASNAPTVDYVSVKDGKIDNIDQAARVIAQSATLTARGMAAHPDLAAAEAFMKEALNGSNKK